MTLHGFSRLSIVLVLLMCLNGTLSAAPSRSITLAVDLSEADRGLLHATMVLPVETGSLTLLYPKYIPGEHGPTGPIVNLAGLRFEANGEAVPWSRDAEDMYTFHLQVPAGVSELTASLDFLAPVEAGKFTGGVATTPNLAVLSWNHVVLYPAGPAAEQILIQPAITLPAGWQFATALERNSENAGTVGFSPVSLETLVDSPVLIGRHLRRFDISPPNGVAHTLNAAADDLHALDADPADIGHYRQLVLEAQALFGARHYRHYDFLLTLSDKTAHFGLEHHESSDNRTDERYFLDPEPKLADVGLLPHELVHSWNGKYRRPADLATPDYQKPMVTRLLWVYEGLTSYLGNVLTARSGLWTADQYRDVLAYVAADMSHRPGRAWRPLADTTAAAQVLFGSPEAWRSWRRGTDFYLEGVLVWLDVDTRIRELTNDAKSLDDFCKAFFGQHDGEVAVRTYTFEDVVSELQRIADEDWAGFFEERLNRVGDAAPLDGIERSGWRLEYTDTPSDYQKARDTLHKTLDLMDSIGLSLNKDGKVIDTLWNGPAFSAGISPGMTLVAVNGRKFEFGEPKWLTEAIAAAKNDTQEIALLMEDKAFFRTYPVDYHGGNRYPRLVRDTKIPDRLSRIIEPQAPPAE